MMLWVSFGEEFHMLAVALGRHSGHCYQKSYVIRVPSGSRSAQNLDVHEWRRGPDV